MPTVTRASRCAVCRMPLQVAQTGRPRRTCSTACRRTAEREVRRLDTRLERLEDEAHGMRQRLAEWRVVPPMGSGQVPALQARLEETELAIKTGTDRMRELLADAE